MKYVNFLCVLLLTLVGQANAELKVNITQGTIDPVPIAITEFSSEGGGLFSDVDSSQIASDLPKIVMSDLQSSGLFRPLDPRSFIQNSLDPIRFSDWRLIQSQALVTGTVKDMGGGKVRVEFRLYDVVTERQMEGLAFNGTAKEWRRIAHKVADAIYQRITGEKGYFDTRIVYVARKGEGKTVKTRLAIMDYDGENHKYLTNGHHLTLTPRFSPSAQELVYLDYGKDNKTPRVHTMNASTKKQRRLGSFNEMTFAPRYLDANNILLSRAESGNSSIFLIDTRNRRIQRLTRGPWIDTSPSASPDGGRIVFNSDRGGSQQLYVMNRDGSGVQRISGGGGRYATPVWSPRGDYIAFTKMYRGQFYIGIMHPDGTGERLLAKGYLVEEPTWSPNGRVIIFTRQGYPQRGRKTLDTKLFMVDVTGYNERPVKTPGGENAISAAWSPLIP
ncbi:MAG: Tol-Pal system beta propeller repeat protein TolB [Alphaproteobacteria bacterium]